MKKTILTLALLTAVLLLTAPVRADVIDDDLEWSSIIGAIPEEEPVPEPVEEPTPAEEQPAQEPCKRLDRLRDGSRCHAAQSLPIAALHRRQAAQEHGGRNGKHCRIGRVIACGQSCEAFCKA